MPQNGYSIGRDTSYVILDENGNPLRFSEEIDFEAKALYKDETITTLNSGTDHLAHPIGWDLKFTFKRDGSEADQYFARVEENYYNGIGCKPITVQETTLEPNGSVSQYQYTNVQLKFDDSGKRTGDSSVTMSVSGKASRRIKN